MQKRKQFQYAVVGVLGFALLFMTVGFAAYAQLVSNDTAAAISSRTTNRKAGFDADSYQQSTTSVTPIEKTISNNEIDFHVILEHPGDSYAAVINVVNNTDANELIDRINMSMLDDNNVDKIDYRITFDDEDYIGTSYDVNKVINRGEAARKQLFITVTYKEDAEDSGPADLNLFAELVFANDAE